MLGLVEINLLPPEFRQRDRTPLPLFLAVVLGVCAVGASALWWFEQSNKVKTAKQEVADLGEEEKVAKAQADEVRTLEGKINSAKKRQEEIRKISANMIMWSQKLFQVSNILRDCPRITLSSLSMTTTGKVPQVVMNCTSAGGEGSFVSEFQSRIQNDQNFYYHFSGLSSSSYSWTRLAGMNFPAMVSFTLTLNLKSKAPPPTQGRRR